MPVLRIARRSCLLVVGWLALSPLAVGQERPAEPQHAPPEAARPNDKAATKVYSCPACDLRGHSFSGEDLTDANLSGADLSSVDLSNATLSGATLAGANLSDANLSHAHMEPSSSGRTDLSSANLSGARLEAAVVTGVDFEYANLAGADFSGVDLTKAIIGPSPKSGVYRNRKTSFRNAMAPASMKTDPETMELTGLKQAAGNPAQGATAVPIVTCNGDVSKLTNVTYVTTAGNDGAGCGKTYAGACLTIGRGIQNCSGASCAVLVGFGQYQQNSTLSITAAGISVYGGCVPEGSGAYYSEILGPSSGVPAVSVGNNSGSVLFQGFKVVGTTPPGVGGASIAMQIIGAASVVNSNVYAATGARGAPGNGANPGTAGGKGSGQTAGTAACLGGTPTSTGGGGAGKMNVSVDTGSGVCTPSCPNGCTGSWGYAGSTNYWAPGGSFGSQNCAGAACPYSSGGTGGGGTPGHAAPCGGGGRANANTSGTFEASYVGTVGGSGGAGGNGGGGGGGGSGGYDGGYCFGYQQLSGGVGGGGGAGGCGAAGGTGGGSGGASFAIVNMGAALTLGGSRVVGGLSGTGAVGGAGGNAYTHLTLPTNRVGEIWVCSRVSKENRQTYLLRPSHSLLLPLRHPLLGH
ncbi:pentapeptide repeat-containing protein [Methylocystis bryophila]|uniref:pentapeptide repeat-containing protein n=1 Tax=Methylocystis bryophila TaxID=655015 RepID=UPI003DB1E10A